MELEEVWLSHEECERKLNYLSYSFNRLDSELFSSFTILPLRAQNLVISSMFYADICVRLYPLLTMAFNILTFGEWMEERLTHWIKTKKEGKSSEYMSQIDLDSITKNILTLRNMTLQDKDGIRDYLKFYRWTENGINKYFDINDNILPIHRIGRIEYDENITPFDEIIFNKYLETRNKIEHRGTPEATLREAFWAFSGLFLILETHIFTGFKVEINSQIFDTEANKSKYIPSYFS